jgi:hypothetical protein
MVEGKIRGRMEEQGGRFFLIFSSCSDYWASR